MDFTAFILGGIGTILTIVFREGEFAGTAEEGARRVGNCLALAGFGLLSWVHFFGS